MRSAWDEQVLALDLLYDLAGSLGSDIWNSFEDSS